LIGGVEAKLIEDDVGHRGARRHRIEHDAAQVVQGNAS
jgi:hypothetical protein